MQPEQVQEMLANLLAKIMGDPEEALAYASGPQDYLTASGVTEVDLSEVDYDAAFEDVCEDVPGGSDIYAKATASASASAAAPASASATATLEHTTNHYVYHTYEGDTVIIEELEQNTNINSTEINAIGDGINIENVSQQGNADGDATQNNDSIDFDSEVGSDEQGKPESNVDHVPGDGTVYEPAEDPKHPGRKGHDEDPSSIDELEENTNTNDTVVNAQGKNISIDNVNQQANADGDVTQNNDSTDIDLEFGGGANGSNNHDHSDEGYGAGSRTETNTNENSTTIDASGSDITIDNVNQQGNADGDVTQNNDSIDVDVEAPVFDEPADFTIAESDPASTKVAEDIAPDIEVGE